MVDKDGVTCTSCLTLNPPDAPACVRCNTPLPLPGASSSPPPQRAPQPPPSYPQPPSSYPQPPSSYPPNAPIDAPAPPRRVQRTPARRRRRRVVIIGNLVVLVLFVGGAIAIWQLRPRYLDTDEVAKKIADELGASVDCPSQAKREEGETFTCTATFPGDRQQTVRVKVVDDSGKYEWTPLRR